MAELQEKLALVRSLAKAGKISRRDFMSLCVAAGVAAATAEANFVSAAKAQPKRGGSFRAGLGFGSSTDSLDPATWQSGPAFLLGNSFGACLTEIDPKNGVQPDLADSFESNDNGVTWIFRLRKGLTFHDGRSVTASDVVSTYNYHRGETSKSAAKSFLTAIESIKSDGPQNVIFTLKSGNVDFPYITSDYHLAIFPDKDGTIIDWQKSNAAGAFILEAFEPGVKATARRNPNYHKSGMPYFDDVTVLTLLDATARNNALTSGEIHYMDRPDLRTIGLLKENADVEIDSVTGFAHYVAPMNVTLPPFDNVNVRLALKWAFDREEIVNKIIFGHGVAGNDNPIPPNLKFSTNPSPRFAYDPDKARFYLKQAGLSSLDIDLSASDVAFDGAVDTAVLMKDHASKAGININVIREAADGYWDNVWMKKPWCMSSWFGRPTCDGTFSIAYAQDASWNDTSWKNLRFNELLLLGRAETDQTKRAAIYAEMQQLVHDDGGMIVLMFSNFVSAHSKAVSHGDLNSNFDLDGGKLLERWWFV